MDNMCCNFCIKDRNGCVGCDYEFFFCGCAIREDSDDLEELAGGIRSANADISNDNGSEKLPRRKTKGSCATLIDAGLVGP